jgi:DNA-binding NarL/FixJ family response regulator
MKPIAGEGATMPLTTDALRVLIVGDSPLARAGLAGLLNTQAGIEVVGQVAADSGLTSSLAVYRADVVAWDMGWEASRSLDFLSEVREVAPPILALFNDSADIAAIYEAGARGLLLEDVGGEQLTAALYAVSRGLLVLNPLLALPSLSSVPSANNSAADALTPRELEVLALVAEGLPNKVIASRLGISEHTVKFHVNSVMSKLGVQSRTEAVVRATRLGMITL